MSDQTAERHKLHIKSVDTYGNRHSRIRVLADYLYQQVVLADFGDYPMRIVDAVSFLQNQVDEGDTEQAEILKEIIDLDKRGGEQ